MFRQEAEQAADTSLLMVDIKNPPGLLSYSRPSHGAFTFLSMVLGCEPTLQGKACSGSRGDSSLSWEEFYSFVFFF